MKQQSQHLPGNANTRKPGADRIHPCKPIDGSQYLEVIEEQEYADRRPTPEEQKPRFSYLRHKEQGKEQG